MQLPRPAAALGVRGGQRAAQPVGLHALRERHGGRGARRERAQHLLVVLAEHARLLAAVERRQHAHRLPAIDHRHEQRRLRVGHPELARGDPQARGNVGDPLGSAMLEHLPGGRAGDRQTYTARLLDMTGARVHDQLLAVAQHDHDAAGAHERAPALDDQLEHMLQRDLPADRDRHVAGRLQAPGRLLGLLAAALAGLIQLRVADRDRRPIGEDHRGLLVLLGELSVPCFSVRYRLPHTCPRITTGTPRKLRIGGWPAGNP